MTPRIYGTRMYGTVTGKQRYPGRLFEVRSEVCVTGVVTGRVLPVLLRVVTGWVEAVVEFFR